MFASFLRSNKRRPSETTPLLEALSRYRSRQHGETSEPGEYAEAVAQYDGEDEDDDEDRGQDGPLLPVFSSELLGGFHYCRSRCYMHY